MAEDSKTSLLLVRSFLVMGRTLIDVELGELILRFHNEYVVFNILEVIRHVNEQDQLDEIEEILEDTTPNKTTSPMLVRVMVKHIIKEEKDLGFEEKSYVKTSKVFPN